jgi:hypothetical protein
VYFFHPNPAAGDSFTNEDNVFTVNAYFFVGAGTLGQMPEVFTWIEGYPGDIPEPVEVVDYNTMAVEEIPGALSEYFSAAFYNENWIQPFSKAVDIHPDEPESLYKNLYYLADLYVDGYGLAFYYDGETITIPENQPTGVTFRQPLYVSPSENIESTVATTAKGVVIYTFGLKFHYEDGTSVGEFAETFYYSEEPVSYSIADFYGNYHLTGPSQFGEADADMNVAIAAGAEENTFVITGINYAATVAATFDPATSTMSIAPQELADYGTFDMTLYATTPDGDVSDIATLDFTFNMSGNLVMTKTSEADGYLLRSEAAGVWVDGYYDLVFTPQASVASLMSLKRSVANLSAHEALNRVSAVQEQKRSKGNFAVQDKVSVRKTLRSIGNPNF